MTKQAIIIDCLHHKVVMKNKATVTCILCGKDMGKAVWADKFGSIARAEASYLLRGEVCEHSRITDGSTISNVLCLDCDTEFTYNEWNMLREPYRITRDTYIKYDKFDLISMVISLRDKLENAHELLEVNRHYIFKDSPKAVAAGVSSSNNSEWLIRENVPLDSRDMMINGIFCRDLSLSLAKDEINYLSDKLEKAIEMLKMNGLDTSGIECQDDDVDEEDEILH